MIFLNHSIAFLQAWSLPSFQFPFALRPIVKLGLLLTHLVVWSRHSPTDGDRHVILIVLGGNDDVEKPPIQPGDGLPGFV